jgi:hypothetical protein
MFRCPDCRTRRADYHLFTRHTQQTQHRHCLCGGYHYKHRPGSPYCIRNPWSEYREAVRQGADEDVLADIAVHVGFENPTPGGSEPPF